MWKASLRIGFALLVVLAGRRAVFAEEGAIGHYMPGANASFIDELPGYPTFAAEDVFMYYGGNVSGSRQLPVGGFTALGLNANSYADSLVAFYETPLQLFGGLYAAGLAVPYVWVEAKATVITPNGFTTKRDTANGVGDIALLPFMLGWTNGPDWKYDVRLSIYAPSGEYSVGSLANVGLNYWTFSPEVTLAYFGSKNGFEATMFMGVDFNTINHATHYQSGDDFHIDGTVAEHLPLLGGVVGLGANAFYYQQITGDSGPGAVLGSFYGETVGIGPVFSYIRKIGKANLAAEVKWLPEIDVKNRLQGNYVWFKLGLVF